MIELTKILKEYYPDYLFEIKDSPIVIPGHKALYINKKYYAGDYTKMNNDINSFNALDSEEMIIKLVDSIIKGIEKK